MAESTKVLLCTADDGIMVETVRAVLTAGGFAPDLVVVADKDDIETIGREIVDADIVYPNKALLTRELIRRASRLRLIHCGTGSDTVDLEAAREKGIYVCSTAHIMAQSTAEHVVFLLLALAKHGDLYLEEMKAGVWRRRVGTELAGRTIGFIGYGHIGKISARIAHAMGLKVLATRNNLERGNEGEHYVTVVDLETLLTEADIVSLHLPLIRFGSNRTEALIGEAELDKIGGKGLGWVVNTSRGAVVEERALIGALQNGTIRRAALDVFATEPLPGDHPLRSLPNVVLTPHIAGETEGALKQRYTLIARNSIRVLRGEKPEFVVGQVATPSHTG